MVMARARSIWTFDLVAQHVATSVALRSFAPDVVFWQDCPDDWTGAQCEERAAHLSHAHNRPFVVRYRLTNGEWSPPTMDQWREGIAAVERAQREIAGQAKQRRLQKRISHAGMPPPRSKEAP
jgi:hypothetical protein